MFKKRRLRTNDWARGQRNARRLAIELSARLQRLADSGAVDVKVMAPPGKTPTIGRLWTLNNVLRLEEEGLTVSKTWRDRVS